MSGTITLLCWVVGTPTKQIFPVEIARDKLWGHAKKEIKEEKKNEFADIDADTLDLWKIAICRSQRSFLESKDFLKNVMATKPLDAIDSLSTEFNDPLPHNHINIIIVKRPYKFSAADLSGDSPLRRSQASPPGEIDKVIAQCLSKYRPRMHELVMNANDIPSFLPTWQPGPSADDALKQHMSKLCIPAVKGNRPSLLLHNLGQNKTRLEKERISRIPNIFCRGEHRILINTSGSGKTRLLLDGLCHRWGFYFTADPKEDFDRAKAMNESKLETPGSIRHVQETATRGLRQLLLSRFLLLGLLVEEVQRIRKQASSLSYRRLWVLLQVQPEQIFGNIGDPFLDLAQLLRPANASELQVRIRKNCQALSSQLNSNHELFHCVLDEAQLTADSRYRVFFSEDGLTRRPLFREIWRSWTTVLSTNQMSLIVSGTGINYAEVMRTLSSTAFKEEDYAVECDVGAFDNPYDQAEYIQLYIPADWTDMRWKEFLKRSWAWFRGRYRNTATLLSLILQAGYKSPHRTINSYVKEFTAFQPTDADDWTKQEPEHSPLPNFSKLNFDRMSNVQARTLANVLFDQALYGTYSLMSFAPEDRATFVEYGFARTKPGPTSPQTILDEPIAILAAMNWVNQNDTLSFFECLRRDIETNSKTGNGFENYFAFYVRAFFETPKSLDELFKFRSDFDKSIDWKSEEFELVTVSRTVGSGHPHISIVTPNCGPSSNIGLRAEKGEEVLSWISTNQGQFTFCFPPKHFGADLLFFIRSTVSKRLLLVMIQCKNYFEVKLQVLIEGVRTVTPDWLWKSKDIKYETAAESVFPRGCPSNASELALQTKDALRGIPLGLTVTTADFPILRVFASWEGDAKLDRSMQKIDQSAGKQTNPAPKDEKRKSRCDVDPHPLATLHLANFNRVSREMDISWFRGDVEQREVVHVKRSTSSVGLDTNTQRLKRARQEDDEMV